MRTIGIGTTALLMLLTTTASAATLEVGPGKTYATPCDAIAAAQPNDVVEVAAGTYTDSCYINVQGLTVRGVGGRPKIDLSGTEHPAGYKGVYVIDADGVRIENLELTGAHISDDNGANGAGLRVEAGGLTVHGCYIHDNQNGILGGGAGTTTIEYTEFSKNGLGNGCNVGGCTHNLYIPNSVDKLVFQYNWTHDIATDGHLFKSRAKANHILYNRITGESGHESYNINLPNGGLAIIVGNVIEKGTNPGNNILIQWGEEGASNPDNRVYVANNTFVNDSGKGTFINVAGAMLTAHNNVFVGAGTISSTGPLSADNVSGIDPKFVDAAKYDYRLQAGSPLLDMGVDPGSADGFSLTPVDEYLHPTDRVTRLVDAKLDVGAFELGTPQMGTGGGSPTSGSTSGSGSASTGSGGAGPTGGSGGGATSGTDATSGSGANTGSGGSGGGGLGDNGTSGGCSFAYGGQCALYSGVALAALALAARRRRHA